MAMNVLMLGWELPPHNSGGLGVACYQLCKALVKKGANIDFVLPYEADHDVDFMKIHAAHPQGVTSVIKSGIAYDSHKYVYADGHEEWMNIYEQQAVYEKAVGQMVEHINFSVVHAHDWLTFRAGLLVKQLTGKQLILHVHSIEADRAGTLGGGNPLVREIEALSFLSADRIVAVSDHTRRLIASEYDIPLEKIDVVHNSLDTEAAIPLYRPSAHAYLEKMREQGYKVVVNIGRITIQKGLTNLLHAAKIVVEKAPKTLFLIVGSGEQYQELIMLAADLGISKNVIFTGFQRGKNLRDSFAVGDLFIMPSVSEPFGLTPLEAAGYGTPSLISKQSGVSEVFTNCLKVDFWDVHQMANQITTVVRSDALQNTLAENALQEYYSLSWHSAAEKLMEWYQHHSRLAGASA